MRNWFTLIVAGGVVLGAWLAFWKSEAGLDGPEVAHSKPVEEVRGKIESPSGSTEEFGAEALSVPELSVADSRTLLSQSVLSGRIVDESGAPVAGAEVSLTPIPERLRMPETDRIEVADSVASTTVATWTSADGRFAIVSAPDVRKQLTTALWITHPGFEARVEVLSSDVDEWPRDNVWDLAFASPVNASVVEATGEPLGGARVVQVGLALDSPSPESHSRLAWLLRREATTSPEGKVRLAPMRGRHRIQAKADGRTSSPWEGQPAPSTTLRVGDMFYAEGSARWSQELRESMDVYVTCDAIRSGCSTELGRVRVDSGAWGPLAIPLSAATEYRFRLFGTGAIAQAHHVVDPAPDEWISIDFDVEPGHVLWFRVVDESENSVPDAEATVRWIDGRTDVSTSARVRDDGFIAVSGCPPGTVIPSFRAPGFASSEVAPLQLPLEREGYMTVNLIRGGTIRGTVVDGERPVADFEVLVWPTRLSTAATRYAFRGVLDGRFELTEVPLGDTTLVVTAIGSSQSTPRNLVVLPERIEDVRIELPATIVGAGTVVDSTTGEPIPQARVRVPASDGFDALAATGPTHRVDADGTFVVAGVAPNFAFVTASAEGYSSQVIGVPVVRGNEADFGTIPLHRTQVLEVHLRHAQGTDPTQYPVLVEGPDGALASHFDREGFARFNSVGVGDHTVTVYYPDRTWRFATEEFVAGDVWYVEFDASTGATLRIDAYGSDGTPPGADTFVSVRRPSEGGWVYHRANLDSEGHAAIHHLSAGVYQVEMHADPDGGAEVVASTRVALDEGDDTLIRLRASPERRLVRVIDEDGSPLRGVSVTANLPEDDFGWSAGSPTDAEGFSEIPGLVADEVFLHLAHPERGYRLGLPVRLRQSDDVVEVVFEAPVRTELVLMRSSGPVVGGRGGFCDPQLTRRVTGPVSDELGRSVWTNLAPGEYVFVFDDEGFWPVHVPVTVARGAAPVRVDLHRLCTVRIEVSSGGQPVRGTEVSLLRVGGATPVRDFVASGHVRSNTGSMTTGPDGGITLDGVGESLYAWAVVRQDNTVVSGTVEVTPEKQTFVRISL